ncbi:MAG: hypothetical protein ABFQ62_05135 [Patescibacteria group bacterium]
MRIVFASDTYLPSINGVATGLDMYARKLSKLGHEVIIVAPNHKSFKKTEKTKINSNLTIYRPWTISLTFIHPMLFASFFNKNIKRLLELF